MAHVSDLAYGLFCISGAKDGVYIYKEVKKEKKKKEEQQHMTKTVCSLKYFLSGPLRKKFANASLRTREFLHVSQVRDYAEEHTF